jgi:signal peptide peptidase SppA
MTTNDKTPPKLRELLPHEPLAIVEAALDQTAAGVTGERSARRGKIAVVDVRGVLLQRERESFFGSIDGFDAIEARFMAALRSDAMAVLLRIDSPGGVVAGCFAAAERMRAAAVASGKPVVAYADELAASAAYALATVATAGIVVPRTGQVGSVGVVATHTTAARALEKEGIDVRVFRSGKRKAEGSPLEPLTDDAAKGMQARVDDAGRQFAELVASARGIPSADVLALEGALLSAEAAVTAKLADVVGSLEDAAFLAVSAGALAGGEPRPARAQVSADLAAVEAPPVEAPPVDAAAVAVSAAPALREGEDPAHQCAPATGPTAREAELERQVGALVELVGATSYQDAAAKLTAAKLGPPSAEARKAAVEDLRVRAIVAQAVREQRLEEADVPAFIDLGATIGAEQLRARVARFPSPVERDVAMVLDQASTEGKIPPFERETWVAAGMTLGPAWLHRTVGRLGAFVPGGFGPVAPAKTPSPELGALAGDLEPFGLTADDLTEARRAGVI